MDLLFSSASLLGLNYEFEFIGENFNFRNRKDLDIEGDVIISSGYSGVRPIWSGISGIISTQTDYKNIVLNGTSFGSGRLNSISFQPGVDVRRKKYSASFSVFSSGNFANLNQSGYSGLYTGFLAQDVRNIESLDETFDFQVNDDRTFTYNRELSFNLQSGRTSADLDTLHSKAKQIATFIFQSDVTFPFLNSEYPSFYETQGKKVYTENYDLVNSQYSFSETFTFQNSNNYIWTYDYSLNTEDGSETSVVEKGTFKGVNLSNYAAALAAFNTNFPASYSRCSGIYNYYYGTGCVLKNIPISIEINRDNFAGSINYTVNYSTSNKYQSGVVWDYTNSCDNSDGTYKVSEKGSIVGLGVRTGKYNAAHSFYLTGVAPTVGSRITGYFTGVKTILGVSCDLDLVESASSITHAEFEGKVDYSFDYSTDSRLRSSGVYGYVETNYSDDLSVPLINTVGILGDRNSEYAISVYRGNSSLGQYQYSISLVPSGDSIDINTLTLAAKDEVSTSLIPSSEYYLSDASLNYDFNNKKFNFNAKYDYVLYRTLNNVLI